MYSATRRSNIQAAKALRLRITVLQEELKTCRTPAEVRCVKESLIDAERQLTDLAVAS